MNGNVRAISFAFCCSYLTAAGGPLGSQVLAPTPSIASNTKSAQPETYRLKVEVQRVILDVVVTDAKGQPVPGLKRDDFKVMEDGAVQTIRFLDDKDTSAGSSSQRTLHIDLPDNTFSNLSFVPPDKPVTIVLFDVLDTPEAALPFARQELVKFIKHQSSTSQIAIFVLTDGLHMLQGFTDEETRLVNAINSKQTSKSRILRDAPLASDEDASPALLIAEVEEMIYQARMRNTIAAKAFVELARFASALPGRKNLIWMSGSFPAEIFPGVRINTDGLMNVDIRAAQDLMRRSRIAVYPVDIRGLQTDPQFSTSFAPTGPVRMPLQNYFGLAQGREHAEMNAIAQSTGGQAFYNTNGLADAVDTAVRLGSSSYSLTYAPTNTRQDGRERKVEVLTTHPGYQLSYRRHYLAPNAALSAPDPPLVRDTNMQHGAPNSSELFFEAKLVPVGGVMTASPDERRALDKFRLKAEIKPARHAKPLMVPQSVQHYDINFAILGKELQMPSAGGEQFATDMRFALAAYTPDGTLLNGTEISVKNSIPAAQREKIESEGYHASMVFTVPEGAATVRIAVRDDIGKRLGTMEVPLPLSQTRVNSTLASPAPR
jgi:VWFA-related protein